MTSFVIHIFLVIGCIGLGYILRLIVENMTALDAQLARLRSEDKPRNIVSTVSPVQDQNLSTAMGAVKLNADADKLAQLKSALKRK